MVPGCSFGGKAFKLPSSTKALTVVGQGLPCQSTRRGFDELVTGARRVG